MCEKVECYGARQYHVTICGGQESWNVLSSGLEVNARKIDGLVTVTDSLRQR
jgi:hypothetical protein